MNNITPKLCRMQPHSQGILSFRYEIGNFCCLIRYQKMSGTWNCLQYDLISFLIFCTLQIDVIVWHKFKRYTSNLYCKEYNLRMACNILLKSFLNLTSHLCVGFSFSYMTKSGVLVFVLSPLDFLHCDSKVFFFCLFLLF